MLFFCVKSIFVSHFPRYLFTYVCSYVQYYYVALFLTGILLMNNHLLKY